MYAKLLCLINRVAKSWKLSTPLQPYTLTWRRSSVNYDFNFIVSHTNSLSCYCAFTNYSYFWIWCWLAYRSISHNSISNWIELSMDKNMPVWKIIKSTPGSKYCLFLTLDQSKVMYLTKTHQSQSSIRVMTSEYLIWTKPIFHFSQWKDNQTTRAQQNAYYKHSWISQNLSRFTPKSQDKISSHILHKEKQIYFLTIVNFSVDFIFFM